MKEFENFVEVAKKHRMCEYGRRELACASSKKDIIDLAFSPQGIEFISNAVAEGWFMKNKYTLMYFGSFLNGKYVCDKKHRSEMYVSFKGAILADKNAYCIIDSDVTLNIPQFVVCDVSVSGNSKIRVSGKGRATIHIYGDMVDISELSLKNVIVNKKK